MLVGVGPTTRDLQDLCTTTSRCWWSQPGIGFRNRLAHAPQPGGRPHGRRHRRRLLCRHHGNQRADPATARTPVALVCSPDRIHRIIALVAVGSDYNLLLALRPQHRHHLRHHHVRADGQHGNQHHLTRLHRRRRPAARHHDRAQLPNAIADGAARPMVLVAHLAAVIVQQASQPPTNPHLLQARP